MKTSVIYQGVLVVSLLLCGCVFAGRISSKECLSYRVLDSADRAVSNKAMESRCDGSKEIGVESDIYPGEWHRFEGAAGQMMPEVCVPSFRCGTGFPGWLDGAHPTVEDGIVQRGVCFRDSDTSSCCRWSINTLVRNCSTFYVYKLMKPPACPLRYCGIETAPDSCSFDKGLCSYMNRQPSEGTDWIQTENVKGFPVRDHTSGNGFFMHASYSWSQGGRQPMAQLISPPMWNIGCVQFYYYRTFLSGGRLDVLTQIGGKTSLVWTVESSDTSGWMFASVPITSKKRESIKIIFQAVLLEDFYDREISALIDDVNVMSDASSCKLHPAQPKDRMFSEVQGSCNFDTSTCGYHNNKGSLVWKTRRGPKSWSGDTRPNYDHTFSNGMYICTDAWAYRRGTKSQLISPVLTNVQCVTFYYYMSGKYVGELNVYTRVQNSTDNRVLKLSGNYGEQWKKATIFLDDVDADTAFRLVFESVRGDGEREYIAIDDISTSTNCRRPTIAKSPARKLGDVTKVRLVTADDFFGYSMHKGRVEVLHDGKWGTICHNSWSIEDAMVVCKMLGFSGAEEAIKYSYFGSGAGDIWLNDVQCTGKEKSIAECRHAGWGVNKCFHSQDVGVVCQTDYNFVPQRGSCTFNRDLCGYTGGDQSKSSVTWTTHSYNSDGCLEIRKTSSVKPGTGTKLTSPVLSSSTKCVEFSYLMWAADADNHDLVGSDIGSLNLYVKPLASDSLQKIWTLSGAQYVEYEIGQVPLKVNNNEQFQIVFEYISGKDSKVEIRVDSIIMLNVSCDLFPLKAIPNADEVKLRLSDGKNKMEGRVEVYYDGAWGTMWDNEWELPIATVACRQLTYAGAVGVYHRSAFGQALDTGPVWSASVQGYCKGNETNIARCIVTKRFRPVPSSDSDAGVECFDVRLVGGSSPNEGRVEINYKGKWGTVCNKGWNMKSANVICRNLGYRRARAISSFGKGTGEIRLSNVRCKGDEVSISSCFYRGWIVDDCDHSQDFGVVCTNGKPE